MRQLDKRNIICTCLLVSLLGLGIIVQYFCQHSKASIELEQLKNEIYLARENNKQLEKEIEKLYKKLETYIEEESAKNTTDDSNRGLAE